VFDFPVWSDTRCRRSNRSTVLITVMPRGYSSGETSSDLSTLWRETSNATHACVFAIFIYSWCAWGDVNDSRSAGGDRHAVVSIRKQFSWESISRRFNRAWRWYTHASKRYGVFKNGNEMNTVIMDAVLYQVLLESHTTGHYVSIRISAIFQKLFNPAKIREFFQNEQRFIVGTYSCPFLD